MMYEIHIKRVNLFIEKECVTWKISGFWRWRFFSLKVCNNFTHILFLSGFFIIFMYLF